jgi:hypothetical protein
VLAGKVQESGVKDGKIGWVVVVVGLVALIVAVPGGTRSDRAWALSQTKTPAFLGNELFRETFETYSNRWQITESPKALAVYDEGMFNIRIISPGVSIWSVPDFELPLAHDFSIQVEARVHENGLDSSFGLVLGYRDDGNFFAVLLFSDGEWQFLRRDETEWRDLTPPDAEPVAAHVVKSITRLRVDVTGTSLAVFVDGRLAGRLPSEPALADGVFGLIAQAGKGYIAVSFDNFIVTGLEEVSR